MDAERAEEIQTSSMWRSIIEEIDNRVKFETQKLRTCKPEDLLLIQARIDVFEQVTRLPGDVIDRNSV